MIPSVALLTFVTLQRLGEMVWGRANERRLLALGAVEVGGGHYGFIVALHASWILVLWWLGWSQPLAWGWVAAFFALQGLRVWILVTLGQRWTTRILVLLGENLVRRGPYRILPHPNYLVVALEVPVLPLCFGLWGVALVFGALNVLMLWWRIRIEDQALLPLRT